MLKERVTRHWAEIGLVLLAGVTAVLVVLAFQHSQGVGPTRSSASLPSKSPSATTPSTAQSASQTPSKTPTETPTETQSMPVQELRQMDALFFGDAFTAGPVAENPETQGYAAVTASELGWADPVIDGEAGTGYVQAGTAGTTYLDRFRELDLATQPDVVVLEGTINDQAASPEALSAAVTRTIDRARQQYPAAQVVLFGPIISDPANTFAVSSIQDLNARMSDIAASKDVPYVDPVSDPWITPQNVGPFISEDGVLPTTAGHAYLGRRLAGELETVLS